MTAMIRTATPTKRAVARPMADTRPARFRWPSEAHLTPRRCGHCGARLLQNDAPTAERPVVDLDCYLCSRTACELLLDAAPAHVTEPAPALPSSACRDCGERPGRSCYAGRCSACERAANLTRPCLDCGAGRLPYGRRCEACQHEYRRARGW